MNKATKASKGAVDGSTVDVERVKPIVPEETVTLKMSVKVARALENYLEAHDTVDEPLVEVVWDALDDIV